MTLIMRAIALTAVLTACACAGHPNGSSHPPPQAPPPQAPPPSEPEPSEPEAPPPAPTDACGGKTCTPPDECIRYVGIGGPSIPLFTCGIPCNEAGECPDGKRCDTIADGPRLCR